MDRSYPRFRVYDSDAKEMTYPSGNISQHLVGGAGDDIGIGISLHWSVKNSFRGWHRQRDFREDLRDGILIFMQSTRLVDKNGREMWEGDVIKIPTQWWHPNWGRDGKNNTYHHHTISAPVGMNLFYAGDYAVDTDECEVVGNIYENPDLMGKE